MHGQQISDNEIYLLIKYIKSVLWRVVKRLSYIEEARCLKVNFHSQSAIVLLNVSHGTCSVAEGTRSMLACTCSVGMQCWYARSEFFGMCNRNYTVYSAFCTTWHSARDRNNVCSDWFTNKTYVSLGWCIFSVFIRNNVWIRHLHSRRILYCSVFRPLSLSLSFFSKRSISRRLQIKVVDQERHDVGWQCSVRRKWYQKRSRCEID